MDLLDAAIRYAESGFKVFPCVVNKKIPANPPCVNGCKDATTDVDLITQWWTDNPGNNIGISTEGLFVVDVDGKDNKWLNETGLIQDLNAGAISLTPSGGKHFYFRAPEGSNFRNTGGKIAQKVDTRANGGYVLAYPSYVIEEEKGYEGEYRWAESHELGMLSELPMPPEWLINQLQRSEETGRFQIGALIPAGQRNDTLFRLGCSMRRTGSSEREILALLSQANIDRCNPPIRDKELQQIAASCAKYSSDEAAVRLIYGVENNFIEDMGTDDDGVRDPGEFPDHLLNVPGIVNEVVELILKSAHRPQPELSLAAALSMMGVLTGRKIQDSTGSRTNIYCLGVCRSGGGKDKPRQVVKDLCYEAGLKDYIGPEGLSSSAGLMSVVEKQPAVLFQIDEIGRFLQTLNNPGKSPHLYHVTTVLMKLFTSADTVYLGDAYADSEKNKAIDQPNVCLFGTTVPKNLYEGLTVDSVTDGFLSRMLIFEAPKTLPPLQEGSRTEYPENLIQKLKAWGEFTPGGNLSDVHPKAVTIPYSDEAKDFLQRLNTFVDEQLEKCQEPFDTLWTRVQEKTRRLALIYESSLLCPPRIVSAEAVRWAAELVIYLTQKMMWIIKRDVTQGMFEKQCKDVIKVVSARSPINRSALLRKFPQIKSRDLDEILNRLAETSQIRIVPNTGRGGGMQVHIN